MTTSVSEDPEPDPVSSSLSVSVSASHVWLLEAVSCHAGIDGGTSGSGFENCFLEIQKKLISFWESAIQI